MQTRFRVGNDAEQLVAVGGDKRHFYADIVVPAGHFFNIDFPVLFIKFHSLTLRRANRAFPIFLPGF
jgi:hypothetical protein